MGRIGTAKQLRQIHFKLTLSEDFRRALKDSTAAYACPT